jgi:hypothetical protein
LKIGPAGDIGELGPKEGTTVAYNWKWYYGIPASALWVILVPAIVLVKANRNPRVLLILVPLLILNLLWSVFKRTLGFGSSDTEMFTMLFHSLVMGITAVWLLAHKLSNRNRFVTFLLALVVMAVAGLTGTTSYGMTEFSSETALISILLAVWASAVIVLFALTGWCCRKRYSGLRFMLWLPVWSVATGIASTLSYFGIGLIIMSIAGNSIPSYLMLLQVFAVGLVFGLCLYVINLPYMILAFCSPFFRERFYACLRLRSMPTTAGRTDSDRLNEQGSDPRTS